MELPLVAGNQVHVRETRKTAREPIELGHAERVIAVGRGFDWLHLPNTALIIGPYDHNWPDAVETAGQIVLNNIVSGRVPSEEDVCWCSSPHFSMTRSEVSDGIWASKRRDTLSV